MAGYQQVTLLQFRTDLSSMLDNSSYWTTAEKNTAINEAIRVWNALTGQWKDRSIVSTIVNTHWHDNAATILYPFRFLHSGYPVYKTSWFDLDYAKTGWEGETTASGGPTRPELWCMMGLNKFAIWPADTIINNMSLDAVIVAPQLINDTDYVNIGKEEQGALLAYAIHKLSFKEGQQRIQATLQHFRQFMSMAGLRNSRLKAATFYKKIMMGQDQSVLQKPMTITGDPLESVSRGE